MIRIRSALTLAETRRRPETTKMPDKSPDGALSIWPYMRLSRKVPDRRELRQALNAW